MSIKFGLKYLKKTSLIGFISIIALFFVNSATVFAHSGGTDEYGCHAGTQPYHCHNQLSVAEQRALLLSIKREYLLNGLTPKAKFIYENRRYKSCADLNFHLLRGVAKSVVAKESLYPGMGGVFALVSPNLYKKNSFLDIDKDGVACGLLEPENTRVPTNLCVSGGSTPVDGTTPGTGFRCLIDSKITNGWLIEVLSVTPDATDAVLAESALNELPYPGNQYFLTTLKVTNLTGKRKSFFGGTTNLKAIGNRAVSYSWENSCGMLIPNNLSTLEIANGESRIGNLCWEINSIDTGSIALSWSNLESCNCNMYSTVEKIWYIALK